MSFLSNDFLIGSDDNLLYHFTNDDVSLGGAKGTFAVDVLSNELSVDQFSVVIRLGDQQRYEFALITADDLDFITADDNEFIVQGPADAEDIAPEPIDFSWLNHSDNGVQFRLLEITGVFSEDEESWEDSQKIGTNDARRNLGLGSVNANDNVVAALLGGGGEVLVVLASTSAQNLGTLIYYSPLSDTYVVPTVQGATKTYPITTERYSSWLGTFYYAVIRWSYINTAFTDQRGTFSIPYYGTASLETVLDDMAEYLSKAHSGYYPGTDDDIPFEDSIPYGTLVRWNVNNRFMARGYAKSVERISKYGYKLTCTSGLGLLDTKMHPGGMYANEPMVDLIDNILGDTVGWIPNLALDSVTITGHLPYDTARNNLHRVLFATGAIVRTALGLFDCDYMIGYPMQVGADISQSAMALQGSVQRQLPANAVEVTEHAFFETANEPTETLFDVASSATVTNQLVVFDKPIVVSSLTATANLTINESHVNYAIVSGYGTLTGKPYTHTTQVRRMVNEDGHGAERVKRCENNELVNSLNSYNVARRMLAYYGNTKTVKAKVVLGQDFYNLRAGYLYNFVNPYGEVASGYLAKQDALVTSVVGSQCTFVTGYIPDANGNTFTRCIVLNASYVATYGNTWTVPDGVTYIKLVLISGGSGGRAGENGEIGCGKSEMTETRKVTEYDVTHAFAYANADQRKPKGGNGGTAGLSGKVLIVEKTVTPGEVITFEIGVGGVGSTNHSEPGAPGAPTTARSASIGQLTSEDGTRGIGYVEPFSGSVYAKPGADGVKGGDGGQTDTVDLVGSNGAAGLPGENVGSSRGGMGGNGVTHDRTDARYSLIRASGGGGGGAAYGANGGNGGSATQDSTNFTARTGDGGDGATATPPSKGTYGDGGAGGHGGGSGGNAGGAWTYCLNDRDEYNITIGSAGLPGMGSKGADGGDGVLLVYV